MTTLRKLSENMPRYPGRAALERGLRPVLGPLAKAYAGKRVLHMLGFWTAWHALGGRKALVEAGICSRAASYRHADEFREMFGVDVEVWQPAAAVQLRREHPAGGEVDG